MITIALVISNVNLFGGFFMNSDQREDYYVGLDMGTGSLVGEGLAVYDYTRNKLPVERKGSWHLTSLDTSGAYTIQPNDSRLAIPIPQTEIDANPNLVQNP